MKNNPIDTGGLLVGKTDRDGGEGIKVIAPEGEITMGGGEVIINEEAAKLHCEELSRINQSTGGVAIPCDAQKTANKGPGNMEEGGKLNNGKILNNDNKNNMENEEQKHNLKTGTVNHSHKNRLNITTLSWIVTQDGKRYYKVFEGEKSHEDVYNFYKEKGITVEHTETLVLHDTAQTRDLSAFRKYIKQKAKDLFDQSVKEDSLMIKYTDHGDHGFMVEDNTFELSDGTEVFYDSKEHTLTKKQAKGGPIKDVELDIHAQRELELFIENDSTLYERQTVPIIKNLITKLAQGKYDHAKAAKLFLYLVEAGDKKYNKELGSNTAGYMLSVPDRKALAKTLEEQFYEQAEFGEYNHFIPAKYKDQGIDYSKVMADGGILAEEIAPDGTENSDKVLAEGGIIPKKEDYVKVKGKEGAYQIIGIYKGEATLKKVGDYNHSYRHPITALTVIQRDGKSMSSGGSIENVAIGNQVMFNHDGKSNRGEVTDILKNGTIVVAFLDKMGSASVNKSDITEVLPKKEKTKTKFLGLFNGGGKLKYDKSYYKNLPEYNGYKWYGSEKGKHLFKKPDGKGWAVIKATDEDLENGNIEFMAEHNLSNENKMAKGGKAHSPKDLPKDGSDINIHMPAIGHFAAQDIVLKYDKKNFKFDIYLNGKKEASAGEREILNNLDNGFYQLTTNKSTKDKYVAVGIKDGYWTVISKPGTKKQAQAQLKLGGLPTGETGAVKTVDAVKAHKKVIGLDYLSMAKGGPVPELAPEIFSPLATGGKIPSATQQKKLWLAGKEKEAFELLEKGGNPMKYTFETYKTTMDYALKGIKPANLETGGKISDLCPAGTHLQTLIFDKAKFTRTKANAWVKEHGLKNRIEITENSYRFRQYKPQSFKPTSFKTTNFDGKLPDGVQAVIGCLRSNVKNQK